MKYIVKSVLLSSIAATTAAAASCSLEKNVEITFYGYPDNDPPSADIAYDCGRGYSAAGTGTYSDPLTFASAPGEFTECEIIYLPYLQKYLRFEDTCAQCTTDYSNGQLHIDIWTGSNSNGGQTQINCEDDLTPDNEMTVILNPSTTLSVNSNALFSSGTCYTSNTYPSANAASYCGSTTTTATSTKTTTTATATATSSVTCDWPGHCAGDSCSADSDCNDVLTCISGVCGEADCTWSGHCAGAICSTDGDCDGSLTCQSGTCE